MPQQTSLVSVEEYLRTSFDPDADYIDGILEERNFGEYDHSDLQAELVHWIRTHLLPLGINAFIALRVHLAPRRYRVPDVCVVAGKRPRKGVVESPPLAVIEVLSSEDRVSRVQTRMDEFLKFGVKNAWLI